MKKIIRILLVIAFIIPFGKANPSYAQVWTQMGIDIDGEAEGDNFGGSVSLNSNGYTIAIGAPTNDGNGTDAGHVKIYEWDGVNWVQKGIDIDGNAHDVFGRSVSLSSDGNLVAISAVQGPIDPGYVSIFEWNGSAWEQKGTNIVGNFKSGNAVSLNSAGNTVIIGAQDEEGMEQRAGHVRIYQWLESNWIQKGTDIIGEQAYDYCGHSVSISSDGNTVAIGSVGNDSNGENAGRVRIFEWNGSAWVQKGTNIDGEAAGDSSGSSVSLTSDGNTVAIGAVRNDGSAQDAGHVRIFEWNGSVWTQKGANINGEAAGDNSGREVSLSSDGNTIAIGAPKNSESGEFAGQVRIYAWDGTTWDQLGVDIDGEAAGDRSGHAVSLNSAGDIVAIGGRYNNETGYLAGHVRIYSSDPGVGITENDLALNLNIYPNPANDELNIHASFKNKTSGILLLLDVSGHTFYQYEFNEDILDHQIDLSPFVAGIYFLEIRVNSCRIIEKMMILE